jgi:hypothetical protein
MGVGFAGGTPIWCSVGSGASDTGELGLGWHNPYCHGSSIAMPGFLLILEVPPPHPLAVLVLQLLPRITSHLPLQGKAPSLRTPAVLGSRDLLSPAQTHMVWRALTLWSLTSSPIPPSSKLLLWHCPASPSFLLGLAFGGKGDDARILEVTPGSVCDE